MPHCKPTMPRCKLTMPQCKPTTSRCNLTIAYCNLATPRCKAAMPQCNPTLSRCTLTTAQCKPTISHCKLTMPRCKSISPRRTRSSRSFKYQLVFSLCSLCRSVAKFYSTTITVLLGEPSPDLFIAIMRYSSSLPFGWSTKVDSVSIAVATSCQFPPLRLCTLYALTLPPSTGCFQSRNTQPPTPAPCFGASSYRTSPGGARAVGVWLPDQPMSLSLLSSKSTVFSA